jgi:hypothetical protein
MADQGPVVAVIRTKNGLTVIGAGMELHYERDPETKRLIETHSSFEPDTSLSDEMVFRKAAWKLASEIAQGLGWTA